ncbi:uncharacterized protein LOC121300809 [Polyodon spathula]|uniref:uncharacterized protein LOC121300809 n=1 Tax=Polyodon spathula TaxID=7913 RepID=UPI001B7DFCA9|nr:uncharacterized protein LOC121300809 [Polyodon spathula]
MTPACNSSWIFLVMLFLVVSNRPPRSFAQSETYSINVEGKEINCKKCPPCHRVVKDCGLNSDTDCTSCEDGTYMDFPTDLRKCLTCRKPCGLHEKETAPCIPTVNRECMCKDNAYQLDGECMPHRQCPLGQGVYKAGTNMSNVLCRRCIRGYFSDVISSTATCKRHTNCIGNNLSIREFGNGTADNVCGPKPVKSLLQPGQEHSTDSTDRNSNASICLQECAHTSVCLSTQTMSIIAVVLALLLTLCVTGWSKYIRKRKKLKKHAADLTQADKQWKFINRETGTQRNALHVVAGMIGKDWTKLLGELGYTKDWRTIRDENKHVYDQALEGLRMWTQWEEKSSLVLLKQAAKSIDRNDIYEALDSLTDETTKMAHKEKKNTTTVLPCIRERKLTFGAASKIGHQHLKKPLLQSNPIAGEINEDR